MQDKDKYTFLYVPFHSSKWERALREEEPIHFEKGKIYCVTNEYEFLLARALLHVQEIDPKDVLFRHKLERYDSNKKYNNKEFFDHCRFGLIDEALDILLDLK